MRITDFIIIMFFVIITLIQVKYIKKLIIPTRKGIVEISTLIVGLLAFGGITIFFGSKLMHYLICLLAMIMFILMWLKRGITSSGFSSMYRDKEKIEWNDIEKVVVNKEPNEIKVQVYGKFMSQNFYFKKADYEKVIDILKSNLPIKSELVV
ncbi:hypothetical protein [Clostridium sp. B9]|uniref:hypothetical protein n=1 Tax=Clostridium sp. B9 TaxID=3423224 RepID=UPI003D2F28ED